MVRQRMQTPKRKRVFVGAEGESERSLARWLEALCEEQRLGFHLDIVVCGGGDSLSIAEHAVSKYRNHKHKRHSEPFLSAWIFLDHDRLKEDKQARRDPQPTADAENLKLVFLKPTLEGLLLRLHPGQETRSPTANQAERDLRKLWKDYRKPPSVEQLQKRFGIEDIRRVAKYDSGLRWVLEKLSLWDG